MAKDKKKGQDRRKEARSSGDLRVSLASRKTVSKYIRKALDLDCTEKDIKLKQKKGTRGNTISPGRVGHPFSY